MGSYSSIHAAEVLSVPVTSEASLLAHVMGDDIDGALRIAESMSAEQRAAFVEQLNRTIRVAGFASSREADRAQFIRATTQNGD